MQTVDLDFGIHHQTWALARMLQDYELTDRYVATTFWKNGREKGFLLEIDHNKKADKSLYIVFFQSRNSDNIVVESWEGKRCYGEAAGTPEWREETFGKERSEKAYKLRDYIDHADLKAAIGTITNYADDFQKERAA